METTGCSDSCAYPSQNFLPASDRLCKNGSSRSRKPRDLMHILRLPPPPPTPCSAYVTERATACPSWENRCAPPHLLSPPHSLQGN
jgi:hypothetical protein